MIRRPRVLVAGALFSFFMSLVPDFVSFHRFVFAIFVFVRLPFDSRLDYVFLQYFSIFYHIVFHGCSFLGYGIVHHVGLSFFSAKKQILFARVRNKA